MLRSAFLFLSESNFLRNATSKYELVRKASKRFVAGEKMEEAIDSVRELNKRGIEATLDYLGENVEEPEVAVAAREEYIRLLETIRKERINSYVSIKLTQMGLSIDEELALENAAQVVKKAAETGSFVRIDMEDSRFTDATLRIFRTLKKDFNGAVGIVIQAYLYRSIKDIVELAEEGANVRICKGAYKEPKEIAYPKKREVNRNFLRLVKIMLSREAREKGAYLAIATHDEKIIKKTSEFIEKNRIGKNFFEFQMLYGIRRDLQGKLKEMGYRMRVYVPYGTHWYPYFMRRLAERPANVFFLLKNIWKG